MADLKELTSGEDLKQIRLMKKAELKKIYLVNE